LGPHSPIPVEQTVDTFIQTVGGTRVASLFDSAPTIENADYYFGSLDVVAELKECTTDFANAAEYQEKHFQIANEHVTAGTMSFRQALGVDRKSSKYVHEFLGLFRPPLGRILKKANRQIKATKSHFGWTQAQGVLFFVNDGFRSLEPHFVRALVANLLSSSYSSINCFVYMTVNTYVEVPGSDYAHLLWIPSYSDRAPDALVATIDSLGEKWFGYLEGLIGPFDISIKTDNPKIIVGSRAIRTKSGLTGI
jgi:hypothetical protein